MISEEVVEKLRARYSQLHPLIFLRSVEHAKDAGELFEILDGFPARFPISWDEDERCWKTSDAIRLNELKKFTEK